MKLIVGLGNPDNSYLSTRHNVGQMIITAYVKSSGLTLNSQSKLQALTTQVGQGIQDKTILAITTQYMNNSGIAVRKITDYYKVSPDNLYLIHDDLDLPVGEYRLQFDRSAAGHNGVRSTIEHLGTQAFYRLRVGIGHPRNSVNPKLPVEDYVLEPFSQNEKVIIGQTIDKIVSEVLPQIMGH